MTHAAIALPASSARPAATVVSVAARAHGRPQQPGDSAAGHHASGVQRVPARSRGLPRGRRRPKTVSGRRSTARAAPSATTCRRSAAPGSCSRLRAATATRRRLPWRSTRGRHADAPVLDADARCQPVIPPRRTSSRGARRSRCSARGWSRRFPTSTLLALEDPVDRDRDGDQRPRRDHRGRRPPVSGASAASGGRRSTRRCSPSAADAYRNEMGITNDLFPAANRVRHPAGADAAVRPASGSGGRARIPHRPPRHRQLRVVHEAFSRRSAADRQTQQSARRRTGLQRDRLRGLSRAGADHRPERESAVRSQARAALLGSAAARRRHRRRHPAGRRIARGDQDAGALGPPATPAAAARRQRRNGGRRDHAGIATRRSSHVWGSNGCRRTTGRD